jgi:hypothetical protein
MRWPCSQRKAYESVYKTPATRHARNTRSSRLDRCGQVRQHVSGTTAAYARGAAGGHCRPLARGRPRQPDARGMEPAAVQRCVAGRCPQNRGHPHRPRLAGAGAPSGHRSGCGMHRFAPGRSSALSGSVCARQACSQCHGRGGRALRPDAGAQGSAGRGGVFTRLWRPARADLRPGGLGAYLRFSCGGSGTGAQVVGTFLRLNARHGLGPLRVDTRTGRARWAQPQDVQQLSGRIEALDRKCRRVQRHGAGRAQQRVALPACECAGHSVCDASHRRRRRARAQGHGRGDFFAGTRRSRTPLRHPHGRMGHGAGRERLRQALF